MLSVTKGIDSLLSTVQMPAGVPVATLAIGKAGAINSALFATAILSRKYKDIEKKGLTIRYNKWHNVKSWDRSNYFQFLNKNWKSAYKIKKY